MTEIIPTVDATAEDANEGAEEETANDADAAEDNSKESDAAEKGPAEEEDTQEEDDAEPPTRKPRTNADWVALRRQQKLDKQKAGKGEQGEDEDDESKEDEDEDDVDDEDAKIIDKRIEKHLAPIKEKEALAELKTEINDFVAQNPDFKPFAEKALKWAQHPSWKDVPTKQLMYAAAGEKLMAIGAKRQKAVIVNTQKTKTGANSGGNSGGTKPVAEMTDAEFEQEIQRVKTQTRD